MTASTDPLFWEDDKEVEWEPSGLIDLSFRINALQIPLDHAQALADAVRSVLPWIDDEPFAGVHMIHGGASGNGWMRPEGDEWLYISKRTRMMLRVPEARLAEAQEALGGAEMQLRGERLKLSHPELHPLDAHATQFARHVMAKEDESEPDFLRRVHRELGEIGVHARKMVAGRGHQFQLEQGLAHARSLMLTDLGLDEVARLQKHGLGPGRKSGFGLFLPHKSVENLEARYKQLDG
ncbi:MAG: type I-MYXAN CRISPR-associated protein Cas6/Cmx6 [Gammaproteobacteria bacterium]